MRRKVTMLLAVLGLLLGVAQTQALNNPAGLQGIKTISVDCGAVVSEGSVSGPEIEQYVETYASQRIKELLPFLSLGPSNGRDGVLCYFIVAIQRLQYNDGSEFGFACSLDLEVHRLVSLPSGDGIPFEGIVYTDSINFGGPRASLINSVEQSVDKLVIRFAGGYLNALNSRGSY